MPRHLLLSLGACLLLASCAKSPQQESPQQTSSAAPTPPPNNNQVVIKQYPAAPPETILFEAKNGNVTFTHRKHYERVKNQCDTCHTKIFPQSRAPINYKKANHRVAEATYTSCATCHAVGATSFAADSNCQKCHANKYE